MKLMTLFGTRPEIIRLSRVIAVLDSLCEQFVVHTGQNSDPLLSDIFFKELGVRAPDRHLDVRADSFAEQTAQIISKSAAVLAEQNPDRLLILGDTNSGLAAFPAARMGIPVFHMEAGNRGYDDRVPEEINRRVIDHCSHVLMSYTERSKDNLVREGIERARIFVTGNPIYEVLQVYGERIESSDVLDRLKVSARDYFLVTLHRAENVDLAERVESFLRGISLVADHYKKPMIVSVHPRTADKLARFGLAPESKRVKLMPPLGFLDFVKLEKNALCVLSDSGTVQEECSIFGVPNVTLRDVTERPETIEVGSNMLTGADAERILAAVNTVLSTSSNWNPPREYLAPAVSRTVAKIVLGYTDALDRRPR